MCLIKIIFIRRKFSKQEFSRHNIIFNSLLDISSNNYPSYQVRSTNDHKYLLKTLDYYFNNVRLIDRRAVSSYLFSLSTLILNYLNYKLDTSVFISIDNYTKYTTPFSSFYKKIKMLFKKQQSLRRLRISLRELSWVFFILLRSKDLSLFRSWLKYKFITTKLRSHKNLISIIKYTIKSILPVFLRMFSLLGVLFCVKGKIGSSGSSKKRMISFSYGVIAKNRKNIKSLLSNISIKSSTGTIGLSFGVFY